MQLIEILYCLIVALLLISLLLGSKHSILKASNFIYAALLLLLIGVFTVGLRWQYIPASLALMLMILASFKRSPTKKVWKILGTIPICLLLLLSTFLGSQMPIFALPGPDGPYAVGNFSYSLVDEFRLERFDRDSKRELFIEVWYPAIGEGVENRMVRTLWQEMYAGERDLVAFLTSYLANIETHSVINAPIVSDKKFPVLVFNHGLYMITSQNTLLMEHLASNGYVILSVAHPYQSMKVNLELAGSKLLQMDWPSDSELDINGPSPGVIRNGLDELVGTSVSKRFEALRHVLDDFKAAEDESARREVVTMANERSQELNLAPNYSDQYLYNYLASEWIRSDGVVEYWVEDIVSVVDNIDFIDAPVAGFLDSLDLANLGVFGMSMGGAAAGEFCKQDQRCRAGANMDGTQFGSNWKAPVLSPFLLLYSHELRGNTDYAYLANETDFHIFSIDDTSHGNLTELPYVFPLMKTLGIAGSIDSIRPLQIINFLHLAFFDHYLKAEPLVADFHSRFDELSLRTLHQN